MLSSTPSARSARLDSLPSFHASRSCSCAVLFSTVVHVWCPSTDGTSSFPLIHICPFSWKVVSTTAGISVNTVRGGIVFAPWSGMSALLYVSDSIRGTCGIAYHEPTWPPLNMKPTGRVGGRCKHGAEGKQFFRV